MSETPYSQVSAALAFSIPSQAGSGLYGPYQLYSVNPGQSQRIEAVTFTATIQGTNHEGTTLILQMRDPTGNVLWQYPTPMFLEPS